ncbi:MAG TPA: hypothetical protein VNC78_04410 [Actinomycetota bacterium]|nr:hypothetical protein [Actinomycetota bacterium]
MATAIVAALVSVLILGFVEGMGRFYPALQTWRRLRIAHGNKAVRAMRERFENTALRKTPRRLAEVLVALSIAWVAAASLLDKRWYEVVGDVLPYLISSIALFRVPVVLRRIAERMKSYERDVGWEPDAGEGDGGPTAIAL